MPSDKEKEAEARRKQQEQRERNRRIRRQEMEALGFKTEEKEGIKRSIRGFFGSLPSSTSKTGFKKR